MRRLGWVLGAGLGIVLISAAPIALAGGRSHAVAHSGTLHGKNSCHITAGTMSFNPPLTKHGDAQRDYVGLTLQLRNCSQAAASQGTFTQSPSFFLTTDTCQSLFAAPPPHDPVAGNILWEPRSQNRNSEVHFLGRAESYGPPVRFTLSAGTTYGGSFQGGANSTFTIKQSRAQIYAACGSSGGLRRLTVDGGAFAVGTS